MVISKIFSKIFGDPNERFLKKLQPIVEEINRLEKKFEKLSDEKLREKTEEFKQRLKKGETLDDLLPEAFAVVREAAKRTLGQRHYDVQLMGGIVLHQGKIAEMKTGEGKTLTATLPLYLNALEGKGCHLVTVNDYLARRDTVWMGQIYHFLGLSVGCLNHEQAFLYDPDYKKPPEEKEKIRDELGGFKVVEDFLRPCSRKEAYLADITYGTNNEFGFDYLRDNMVLEEEEIVQRELHYAIVDEVDSILIDEARTPLIISIPDTEAPFLYKKFAQIVPLLKENEDFNIDEKRKTVTLTEKGIEKMERLLGKKHIYERSEIALIHHMEEALKAQFLFKKDRDYVVKDGKVIIVDEFTGRLLPGRRYSGGLHQAIEAKEGVPIQQESRTLATITFQNYFRMYKKLAGMTGTAATSAEEFEKVYGLETIIIPTAKPMIRKDLPDKVFLTQKAKYKAVIEEIKKRHKKGQPVLVGTTSIEKNEYLSSLLKKEGIPHQVLNAKHHEREGEIIAQAGRKGAVTIATNMAGRGVDIILGGNPPDKKEAEEVKRLGGLHVIGTERHESRRIDNQLRGRAGRQGDPGSSQFFLSLEDDLVRIFAGENVKRLLKKFNFPEDLPIENKMVSKIIEKAQARVEGYNFDIRKHLLEFDDVLNKQRDKFYKERRKLLREENAYSYLKKIIKNKVGEIIDFHLEKGMNIEEIAENVKSFVLEKEGEDIHQRLIALKKKKFDLEELSRLFKKEIISFFEKILKERENKYGEKTFKKIVKIVILKTMDYFWMEHLENMEYLRDAVNLRAFGQIDPLVAYRKEGHLLFQKMMSEIEDQIMKTIFKIKIETQTFPSSEKRIPSKKPGRNDPCPCGSGKKYKKCCYPKFG